MQRLNPMREAPKPGPLDELLAPCEKMADTGIPVGIVNDLMLRVLFNEGDVSLGRFREVIRLPPAVLDEQIKWMQKEHLVEIAKAGGLGRVSFVYSLTDAGRGRARDAFERSQYVGPAPVPLEKYRQAIALQARRDQISAAQMEQALSHLVLPSDFHRRIGPAVNSGNSLFIYGLPGNGKTSIARAIAGLISGSDPVWLPYAITTSGQIIQVQDPLVHKPVGSVRSEELDERWARVHRPTVMVGGELTMESLDLRYDPTAKFYEAPLQLKANGGMFLIDDFGRQQVPAADLLNRWIVPLEMGIDILRLRTGQTLEVPFRQMIVFSTNLDPNELVDEAFLRRIQMKVEVGSPDERMFYQIFVNSCQQMKIPFHKESFLYFLQEWYRKTNREFQAVHARDVLRTVAALCQYDGSPSHLTPQLVDEACRSYFV
jgi:predicted ATPase with chaperone activity